MPIRQCHVRSLSGCFAQVPVGSTVVLGAKMVPRLRENLERLGFPRTIRVGDTILPAEIGPITKFNAEGREIIHRDQPKEPFCRMILARRSEFRGRGRTTRLRLRRMRGMRYPRTVEPPPGVELTIAALPDGQQVLVAPARTYRDSADSRLIHVVNLLLEVAGECDIYTADLVRIEQPTLRQLNWRVLPPEVRTWTELRPRLQDLVSRAPEEHRAIVEYRFEEITSYQPTFVAVGRAGFAGYIVFGFPERNRFVCECVHTGNATYVFGEDWRRLSRLTKRQVLNEGSQLARLVHDEEWPEDLQRVLESAPRRAR